MIAFLKANGRETSQGISRSLAANVKARTAADHANAVTNSNNSMVVLGRIAACNAPAAAKAPRAAPREPAHPPSVDARYCEKSFRILMYEKPNYYHLKCYLRRQFSSPEPLYRRP